MLQEEEDRQKEYLDAQIARAAERAGRDEGPSQATELHRTENGGAALRMALPKSRLAVSSSAAPKPKPAPGFQGDEGTDRAGGEAHSHSQSFSQAGPGFPWEGMDEMKIALYAAR